MREPKLFISDIDGTLVSEENKRISKYYEELAELVKRNQIPFTIASGRSPEQMEEIIRKFDIKLPIVAYNGALLVSGDHILSEDYIRTEYLRDAILEGDKNGLGILIGVGDHEYCYRKNAYIDHHERDYGWKHEVLLDEGRTWETIKINKILFFDYQGFQSKSQGKADLVWKYLKKNEAYMNILRYDGYCCEAMPGNVSKASAIKKMAEYLGLDIEEIAVFGDSDNDIEMFTECGMGIAVNNATAQLKKAASYITDGKDSEGVLEGIKKFWKKNV